MTEIGFRDTGREVGPPSAYEAQSTAKPGFRGHTSKADAENHRRQREVNPGIPLFDQPGVRAKIKNFHVRLTAVQVPRCVTCSEKFPGLTVRATSDGNNTECVRCRQDKHIPKLYCSANNMNPGPIPSELLVCYFINNYTSLASLKQCPFMALGTVHISPVLLPLKP